MDWLKNFFGGDGPDSPKYKSMNKPGDPIQHVVVLMLENQSFDHVLGCMKAVFPNCEGIPDPPRECMDTKGKVFVQHPTKNVCTKRDLGHELDHVTFQISEDNTKFVHDIEKMWGDATDEEKDEIMGYYPLDFLPATHALARNFTFCDHWHSSVPGPTWPNRLFALSGTSKGIVVMYPDPDVPDDKEIPAFHVWDQNTIFDRLSEAGVRWKMYYSDFPLVLLLTHCWKPFQMLNYRQIDRFFEDCQKEAYQFPQFSWIEPRYGGDNPNDDHPPHDTTYTQDLIARIYNALRANEELWNSTLFVVTYDEHGGYYDHVQPPKTVVPDEHTTEYHFEQLGVRVPTLLVSPWVDPGPEHGVYDHTSLLKYLIDKWDLGDLGNRTASANTFAHLFKEKTAPRKDTPLTIESARHPEAQKMEGIVEEDNSIHQLAKVVTKNVNKFGVEPAAPEQHKSISSETEWDVVESTLKTTIEGQRVKEKVNTRGEEYVKYKGQRSGIRKKERELNRRLRETQDQCEMDQIKKEMADLHLEKEDFCARVEEERDLGSLLTSLADIASGDLEQVRTALLKDPRQYDADCLWNSLGYVNNDEGTLIQVLLTRNNAQRKQIERIFERDHGTPLRDAIQSATAGDFETFLVRLLEPRDEGKAKAVDMTLVKQDAERLYKGGEAKWGTDDNLFIEIFARRSFPHLKAVFQEYEALHKHSMTWVIESEFSGKLLTGLKSVVSYVNNPAEFWAEVINGAMLGAGTDDDTLIRALVTNRDKMQHIKKAYQAKYDNSMYDDVQSETSGQYKETLLKIINHYEHHHQKTFKRMEDHDNYAFEAVAVAH